MEVSASHLNEDVLGIEGDLSELRVYYGREREHLPCLIVEDWVLWFILNDVQVLLKLLILPQLIKQLLSIHLLTLLKRLELYLLRSQCLISHWPLHLIQIMSSH